MSSNTVVITKSPDLSVVICFRDWGLDRLNAAIRSHLKNAQPLSIEVIVSDYGSENASEVLNIVTKAGGRVVRTETSKPWSRSASLNAGVAACTSDFIISTDADIIFSPESYLEAFSLLKTNPNALYLIQCRDLAEQYNAEKINELLSGSDQWIKEIDSVSTIRPRWGMGGFAAFTKAKFIELNGYDERMQIWGGEDNDFALRFKRAGYPLRWLSADNTRIYHIWHEPSQSKATQTELGKISIAKNREILQKDSSIVRNLKIYSNTPTTPPLVSIIIPTFKRGRLLLDCLQSCLKQTFKNFEIVVVENGDSNEAKEVTEKLNDKRINYFKTNAQGAAVARNIGLESAKGRYIVIHDDDDIMISTRLEDHLSALQEKSNGTYSGWIDFDDETHQVTGIFPGKEYSFEALLCNGKVLTHGSLMLDKNIFRIFRYQEGLSAGIDYGFLLLLARKGLKLNHTGKYGILRRMHSRNMTLTDSSNQKSAAIRMAEEVKAEFSAEEYRKIREIGLKSNLLKCSNEDQALEELSQYTDGYPKKNFKSLDEVDKFLEKIKYEAAYRDNTAQFSPSMQALIQYRQRFNHIRHSRGQ